MEKLNINQWAAEDRPREKMMQKGAESLTDAELLGILIGSGNTEESAVSLMQRILSACDNNLNQLAKWEVRDFARFKGMGPAKSITVMAANAFSEAFRNAGPKILEPIYDVEVFVPSDKLGDVMSDMQGRRGMIMGMSSEKGYEKLAAKVPLKEMSNYSTALSSLTGGRASFIMKFASYELVPTDVQNKLMKEFEEQEKEDA